MLKTISKTVMIIFVTLMALLALVSWFLFKATHYTITLQSIDCGGFSLIQNMRHEERFMIGTSENFSITYKKIFSTDLHTSLYNFPGFLKPQHYEIFEKIKANDDTDSRQWHIYVDPDKFSIDEYTAIAGCMKKHISEINTWQKIGSPGVEPFVFNVGSISYAHPSGDAFAVFKKFTCPEGKSLEIQSSDGTVNLGPDVNGPRIGRINDSGIFIRESSDWFMKNINPKIPPLEQCRNDHGQTIDEFYEDWRLMRSQH